VIDAGRRSVLGVLVSAVDYEAVVARVIAAAEARFPLAVTALAVHGVMTGHDDAVHRGRLNAFDIVTPDGQPVRWALRWLHGVSLPERVYGPTLTKHVLSAAQAKSLPVYFYGSDESTVRSLVANLEEEFPHLVVAGYEPSRFRRLSLEERQEMLGRIRLSGARIVFVGLGCPRQEVWVFENVGELGVPVISVGAAFDFHAGGLPQAPKFFQDNGLEWLFRFAHEPARLWRRYLILNPRFLWNIGLQLLRMRDYPVTTGADRKPVELYG